MLSKKLLAKAKEVSARREDILRLYSEDLFLKLLELFDIPWRTSDMIDNVRVVNLGATLICEVSFTLDSYKYIGIKTPDRPDIPELWEAMEHIEHMYILSFKIFRSYINSIRKDLEKQNIYVHIADEDNSINITLNQPCEIK